MDEWIPVSEFNEIGKWVPAEVLENLCRINGQEKIAARFHEPVMTVSDVVKILDVDHESILKALFVKFGENRVSLVCTAGFNKVDIRKVRKLLSDGKADLLPVKKIYEYSRIPLGAISPITYQIPPVLLDPILSRKEFLHLGSGSNQVSFRVTADVLKGLEHITWSDVTKERHG